MSKSNTHVQPYLYNFNGRCEEALEFYRTAVGAEILFVMRFKDSPVPCDTEKAPAGYENRIMHSTFRIGESTINASDGQGQEQASFEGFSLSLNVPDETAANGAFTALAEGGKVTMPLGKTFWSPCFGMLVDRFGVGWMIIVPGPMSQA
jgi:PhnB protein